ncbi:efflux RND transporter periplasmic adaptor subunit [Cupriavidus sp. IK-TO18]|uniref:Biotin/lipoyl-binding protein n=2 Tax=Cupriavidus oxalaticus TaxID=96344 RepID=A0A4V1BY47_9BURK|nr:HlyD family efflux transporter periplasmic adaptor subunit [Cupriavidus sp. IK-TO18]MBF6990300.1 efflux RND transporter periplasmic adaptor subunit [Cupriavidus sp. IK-TO18]QBY50562.1 biotin/lipoyl-binding protein [Cupriavidus oxalaticus]
MSRITRFVAIAMALAASAGMPVQAGPGAHGPDGEHLDVAGAVSGTGLARLPDGSVHVPKLAQRRMGIRTAMPQEATHPMTVELNAVVAIDPNAGGRLQAGHAGWIEPPSGGFPVLGQRVARGQVLAVLRHKNEPFDTGNQQARLASLSADLKLAQQRLARLESLQDSIPRKEIEAVRAEVRSLSGQRDAVGKSLRHTDNLTAPASGIIATANVLAGQVVAPGDVLYEVLDPERMLIEANTADATLAGRIQGGTLGRADGGKLEFVGAGRSLKNGAVPLMFRLAGKTLPLAVGQPVTVVATLTDTATGIALPAEALVRNASNVPVVWIKSGTQRFIAQPVEARVLDARTVVVVRGLSPENRVVVSGAALINQVR